jgi:hypothetical protein
MSNNSGIVLTQALKIDIQILENPNLIQILPRPLKTMGLGEMVNEFKQIYILLVALHSCDQTQNTEIRRPIIWPCNCRFLVLRQFY